MSFQEGKVFSDYRFKKLYLLKDSSDIRPMDIDAITKAFKRLSAGGFEIDSMAEQARKISLQYS